MNDQDSLIGEGNETPTRDGSRTVWEKRLPLPEQERDSPFGPSEREAYYHALNLVSELSREKKALQSAIREITEHVDKFEELPDDDPDEYQSTLHIWLESLTVSLARASYLLPEKDCEEKACQPEKEDAK